MARTLKQLKESIETLIAHQGEDAPVAAFIFTKEDVCYEDDDCVQHHLNEDETDEVLNNVEENDWIYEQVFSCIDDEIKDLKRNKK
jgi:hypothetical protein